MNMKRVTRREGGENKKAQQMRNKETSCPRSPPQGKEDNEELRIPKHGGYQDRKPQARPPIKEYVHLGVCSSSDPADSIPSRVFQILYLCCPLWWYLPQRWRERCSSRRASRTGRSKGSSCRRVILRAARRVELHPGGPAER